MDKWIQSPPALHPQWAPRLTCPSLEQSEHHRDCSAPHIYICTSQQDRVDGWGPLVSPLGGDGVPGGSEQGGFPILWSVDLSQGLGQFPSPSPGPVNTSESLLRLRL